jgi:glycosyltransferase involved in cell wall biosynthesis
MKIAMFTDAYKPRVNGVAVAVDTFARALRKAGHEVMVVCPLYEAPQSDYAYQEPDGVRVLRVPSLRFPLSKEDRVARFDKLLRVTRAVDAFAPEVIHVHSEAILGEHGFYYAKLRHLPLIYTFQTLWEQYVGYYVRFMPECVTRFIARRLMKLFLRRADLIIVPTPQIEDVVRGYKIKRPVRLLPTGIDPDEFQISTDEATRFRSKMEERYPALRGQKILLFVGRITQEKNVIFLMDMLPLVLKKCPETVLVVAGNGPELPQLKKICQERKLDGRCIFPGYLSRREIALAYAVADIFVFPSLTETQGLVTIEAMYSGTPVVAIGSMGTRMVMGGDHGGFMVDNDAGGFSRRVAQLLTDEKLYAVKAAEAREHSKDWLIGASTERLLDIYREAIAKNL